MFKRLTEVDQRLQAVKSYLELMSTNDKTLEEYVYLASEICQSPIASITFVDDKYQYPVVGVGNVIETSCDIAFCNHTIQQTTILEIPDAQLDPRFQNNPLVTGEPFIRFYAGVPLITSDGISIGSLCAIAQEPKKLTDRQIKGLELLSKQVMQRLEMKLNLQRLKESIEEVEHNKALLEQAEIMKTAFYDRCEDYFVLLNSKFEIVYYNSSIENLFIKRNNALQKGKKIIEYLEPPNVPVVQDVLLKAISGETGSIEVLGDVNRERPFWSRFTVSPTYDSNNRLIGIACMGCNIDEEKRQQEEIKLQKLRLSQIAQLHSHDIRHPLTNILAIVDILKQEDFKLTEQYLGYLEHSSKELDAVIRKIVIDSHEAA